MKFLYIEAVVRRCSVKYLFLASPANLLKKSLCHRCFPVNFVKFLRIPFLTEHFWWLFLSDLFTQKTTERHMQKGVSHISVFVHNASY